MSRLQRHFLEERLARMRPPTSGTKVLLVSKYGRRVATEENMHDVFRAELAWPGWVVHVCFSKL